MILLVTFHQWIGDNVPITAPSQGLELVEYQAVYAPQLSNSNVHDFFSEGASSASAPWISNWTSAITGSGSTVTFPIDNTLPPGVILITAGTTTVSASLVDSDMASIYLPLGDLHFSWRFSLPILSDATDAFLVRAGVGTPWATSGDVTNGLYVEYQHSIAGGALRLASANAGVRTYAQGVTALSANVYHLVDVYYSAQPEIFASMYVDGVFQCELTTGFPDSTIAMQVCAGQIIKSAGILERSIATDLVFFGIGFPSGR